MPELRWRTSSFSEDQNCVEVADLSEGGTLVRDTKLGASSPVFQFTASEWSAFIAAVRAGAFD